MKKLTEELLVKNILCALGAGVIINIGMADTAFASKIADENINVTADISDSDIAKMKSIAEDVANVDKRLNHITNSDNKDITAIDKDEVLIDLEEARTFNPNTVLKAENIQLPQDNEVKNIKDFADKSVEVQENTDGFVKTKQSEEIDKSIHENTEVEVDKDRDAVKSAGEVKETAEKNEAGIEKNNTILMEKPKKVFALSNEERNKLREQAVADARSGVYDKALPVLAQLHDSDKTDTAAAYDYMTVLNWAGKYEQAIKIYEDGQYGEVPDYVKMNIAGAYYRLNLLDKVADIIIPLVENDNKEASLLLAQTYLRLDRIKEADDVYNELIIKYPDDMDIYLNRAQAAIAAANWSRAARDWTDVLNLYEKNPDDEKITKQQILDNLSASYIRIRRFKEAAQLLKPYVENKTASASMVGNYITALNNTDLSRQAEKIYYDFFPSYDKAPAFVTRELANSYIKTAEYKKAVNVYEYLVSSADVDIDDRFNLAYYACLSGVDKHEGLQSYREILSRKDAAKYTARILSQAQDFLRQGYYNTAKDVYYELINYDKRFHNIYAGDLVKERQYQSALHEYYAMTKDADLKKSGVEGIVQTSVLLKDYKTAEERLKQLDNEFKNISYDKAKGSFTNKQMGEVDFNVFNYSDHDDSDETDVNVFVKQYVDNGFWIEGSVGKSYIKDEEDSDTTILDTNRVGIRYTARKWDTLLAWSMFGIDSGDKNGLYINTLFRPTDRQSVNFIYGYEPVCDVDALDYEDGSIFGDNYILRYVYDLNTRESYYLELRKSDYTDDNKRYGWEIGQQYNIYNEKEKKGRTLDRTLFWSRDRYSNQDVPYTSPKLSENIGSEWKWGLDLGNDDTLYYILGANWKRDYPDELAFAPYVGIEYNKYIGDRNFYSISAGYGWQTQDRWGKGSWDYDNKQISFSYNITW